jgi:hypothetical protein
MTPNGFADQEGGNNDFRLLLLCWNNHEGWGETVVLLWISGYSAAVDIALSAFVIGY